jgi:hypothetical protein
MKESRSAILPGRAASFTVGNIQEKPFGTAEKQALHIIRARV